MAAALIFLASAPLARADSMRWIGWSPDESRYAYLLRQPYGETGYTGVRLIVRNTKTGVVVGNYVVRDARRIVEDPPIEEETEEELREREVAWSDELLRRGYQKGRILPYKITQPKGRPARPGLPMITPAIVEWDRRKLIFSPTSTRSETRLNARVGSRRSRAVQVSKAPIQPLYFMTGLPEQQVFRIPATYPTGFYLSPSGKWMASSWQGRATLPDGFSWPLYSFSFPVSALPRN
jgi:hypothetical protein